MDFYNDPINYQQQPDDSEKIYSIVTGIVKQNWDQEHPGMVQVEFFLGQTGKNLTGWVPVMMPYAGKEYGFYALPEVGDMVVIAFERGDRNCPIVIGSLWSKTNTLPPNVAEEKNETKLFLTKGGCTITLKDTQDEQSIQLMTPKGLSLTCNDKEESIKLSDQAGENCLQIDCKNGNLSIKAKTKIELDAGGTTIVLDGGGKSVKINGGSVEIKGDQKLTANATNVQVTGSMMTIKGDSTAKVESGSMLQIKGGMVKIN